LRAIAIHTRTARVPRLVVVPKVLWIIDGVFDEAYIRDARHPSEEGDLHFLNLENLVERQPMWLSVQGRREFEPLYHAFSELIAVFGDRD
jgi:hypothetical protein